MTRTPTATATTRSPARPTRPPTSAWACCTRPSPRSWTSFAADGYDLLLAGHTHGGQLRVPGFGALVTNCGIDRGRVSGLSMHPQISPEGGHTAWLHVSAGLGTSPWAPARFACRPEATLLTLIPRTA